MDEKHTVTFWSITNLLLSILEVSNTGLAKFDQLKILAI